MRYKLTMPLAVFIGLSLVIGFSFHPSIQARQPEQRDGRAKQETTGEPSADAGEEGQPMMQCPMMAGMKGLDVFADSPAVLRSRAEALGLSEKQVEQLEEIEESARLKARKVLTEEQRNQLKKAPEGRLSMMELSQLRSMKMQKNGDGMMCPMCMKMMQKKGQNGSE